MRRTKEIEEDSIAGINMAPIINVALVLVIILIITAPILSIPNIPVSLPRAVTIEAKERNITISYAKDGRIAINTQVVSWEDMVPNLKYRLKEDSKALVIIRADFDIVVKKAGAKRIAVATEQRREYRKVFK